MHIFVCCLISLIGLFSQTGTTITDTLYGHDVASANDQYAIIPAQVNCDIAVVLIPNGRVAVGRVACGQRAIPASTPVLD